MKIDREQIEQMAQAMCGYCTENKRCVLKYSAPCSEVASQDCTFKESAEELICKGYGKISEYKAQIEQLKSENEQFRKLRILGNEATIEFHDDVVSEPSADYKDIEKYAKQFRNRIISINEKEIKQAKIDVLNELKERTYRDSVYYPEVKYEHKYVHMDDIDEMIEELEK